MLWLKLKSPRFATAQKPPTTLGCSGVLNKNHGNGEIPMLLACLPYGPSERMQGIWATALEHSAFYENASDARPEMFQTFGTHLVVDGGPAAALRSMQGEKQRAFRVELIGRRSRCAPAGVWERDVVLERFISARELSVD
jgi:hypothetical protein